MTSTCCGLEEHGLEVSPVTRLVLRCATSKDPRFFGRRNSDEFPAADETRLQRSIKIPSIIYHIWSLMIIYMIIDDRWWSLMIIDIRWAYDEPLPPTLQAESEVSFAQSEYFTCWAWCHITGYRGLVQLITLRTETLLWLVFCMGDSRDSRDCTTSLRQRKQKHRRVVGSLMHFSHNLWNNSPVNDSESCSASSCRSWSPRQDADWSCQNCI